MEKTLNIYQKMLAITNEIGVVAKNLSVSTGKSSYKAVNERDILDAVRPLEVKYGVYSYPLNRSLINNEVLTRHTTNGDVNSMFIRTEIVYRFVNIDNPEEYVDIMSYGDGIDTGDKAPGKAMTYADKYALMKAYKISTGDDPDKEASPDGGYGEELATKSQIALIKDLVEEKNIPNMLTYYKVNAIEELTKKQAIEIITAKKK